MNRKEVSEIRKRFTPDNSAISRIRGCYVNTKGEVVSAFERSPISLPQEEAEKYMSIFKKVLSGTPGKNLLSLPFSNEQVADSDEHRLLMQLRDTGLREDECVQTLCARIINDMKLEDNYLILLMQDAYDVPFRAKDDVSLDDISGEVFNYIVCAVCPVKPTKPALRYDASENEFHSRDVDFLVSAPEVGFMFPSFDDRACNIYNVQYYTRDTEIGHPEFIESLFNIQPPASADAQKEAFQSVLCDALEEECNMDVMQAVHEQIRARVEETKADKEAEPVTVSKKEMRDILQDCGVSENHVAAFEEKFDTEFGEVADLSAENIVETRQFEVRTPNVVIKVDPKMSDVVQTRVIDGIPYILVRVDEGVEVNGVNIALPSSEA